MHSREDSKKYQYTFPDIPLHGLGENSFYSRALRHFNRKTGYGENMSVTYEDYKMKEEAIAIYFYQKLKDSKPHYRNMTLKTYHSTHNSIYEKEVDGRYYYVICQLLPQMSYSVQFGRNYYRYPPKLPLGYSQRYK